MGKVEGKPRDLYNPSAATKYPIQSNSFICRNEYTYKHEIMWYNWSTRHRQIH